jgi:hypothetical protein
MTDLNTFTQWVYRLLQLNPNATLTKVVTNSFGFVQTVDISQAELYDMLRINQIVPLTKAHNYYGTSEGYDYEIDYTPKANNTYITFDFELTGDYVIIYLDNKNQDQP